ncbi:MAG: hypothetical protein LBL90_00780 [Prevotellaceae bacterium]|jgi:hypothetical protein|nr:hypothetical protein [Prevotellaceae bacterium]
MEKIKNKSGFNSDKTKFNKSEEYTSGILQVFYWMLFFASNPNYAKQVACEYSNKQK